MWSETCCPSFAGSGPPLRRSRVAAGGLRERGRERRRNQRNTDKFYLVNNTMHVAAQWPFLQADYPSQSLCYIKKRGKNRAPKKRKGGLYSSNQCCPLCCLTFEGLVINDCWLLYLNVSPQLPGTVLIGSRTCRWPQLILWPPNSPVCFAVRAGRPLSLCCWRACPPSRRGGRTIAPAALLPVSCFFAFWKKEEEKKTRKDRTYIKLTN